jgi:ferritin-like metal-binding protein YciE
LDANNTIFQTWNNFRFNPNFIRAYQLRSAQPFIPSLHQRDSFSWEHSAFLASPKPNATTAHPKGFFMKLFSAHIEDLRSLYISSLKKALDMEQKITKALPDLIDNSSDSDLAQAFRSHLEETKGHVSKIQGLLQIRQRDDSAETCKVIDGLITEASDTIKDVTDPSVRDIALIGTAQQVEHHEIALYGTLRQWAETECDQQLSVAPFRSPPRYWFESQSRRR